MAPNSCDKKKDRDRPRRPPRDRQTDALGWRANSRIHDNQFFAAPVKNSATDPNLKSAIKRTTEFLPTGCVCCDCNNVFDGFFCKDFNYSTVHLVRDNRPLSDLWRDPSLMELGSDYVDYAWRSVSPVQVGNDLSIQLQAVPVDNLVDAKRRAPEVDKRIPC